MGEPPFLSLRALHVIYYLLSCLVADFVIPDPQCPRFSLHAQLAMTGFQMMVLPVDFSSCVHFDVESGPVIQRAKWVLILMALYPLG